MTPTGAGPTPSDKPVSAAPVGSHVGPVVQAGAKATGPAPRKRRPKDIGTATETAVVRYLQANGFPHAERRALRGTYDCGDVTGCPGLVFEVKGGKAAKTASDGLVSIWLDDTETERRNATADIGILVLQRAGIGAGNAGRWWAVLPFASLSSRGPQDAPVRMHLDDACRLLHAAGYGDPIEAIT